MTEVLLCETLAEIQDDNRVLIPPAFLEKFGKTGARILIAAHPDGVKCLCLVPSADQEEMDKIIEETANFEIIDIQSQGRISMPPDLKEYAGLKDEVVFAQYFGGYELWDKKEWDDNKPERDNNREFLLNRL